MEVVFDVGRRQCDELTATQRGAGRLLRAGEVVDDKGLLEQAAADAAEQGVDGAFGGHGAHGSRTPGRARPSGNDARRRATRSGRGGAAQATVSAAGSSGSGERATSAQIVRSSQPEIVDQHVVRPPSSRSRSGPSARVATPVSRTIKIVTSDCTVTTTSTRRPEPTSVAGDELRRELRDGLAVGNAGVRPAALARSRRGIVPMRFRSALSRSSNIDDQHRSATASY